MKRIIILLLVVLFVLSSCGKSDDITNSVNFEINEEGWIKYSFDYISFWIPPECKLDYRDADIHKICFHWRNSKLEIGRKKDEGDLNDIQAQSNYEYCFYDNEECLGQSFWSNGLKTIRDNTYYNMKGEEDKV